MRTLIASALALLAAACGDPADAPDPETPPPPPVENLDAEEAAAMIDEVLVLDVRTPREHESGAIAGSVNVDWQSDDFAERVAMLPKDKPVLVHCERGGRSTAALDVLREAGFERIVHLDGGMSAWREAGLPIE